MNSAPEPRFEVHASREFPDWLAKPRVKVISGQTGGVLNNFLAHNANFTGGVRVAGRGFDGDNKSDIITALGPGAPPRVQAFAGDDRALLASFLAYAPTLRDGVFIASGDMRLIRISPVAYSWVDATLRDPFGRCGRSCRGGR